MSQVDTLDTEKLASYLEASIEGFKGPMTAEKFPGGQSNPTFKLTAASGTYVLRRQPPGALLKSAHAVDREFRVIQALHGSDVPVARAYHLCEDRDVIGSMFYVMEYCEGNIHWDAALVNVDSNETRTAMYDEMNRVLVALHRVDINAVGLSDFGKPGNYFERQVSRWTRQYRAAETRTIAAMDGLIQWLEANVPADDGRISLVHGDYRLDNMVFSKDNSRVIAVLDWELSTLGHPFADLAYQCMQLRLPAMTGNAGSMFGLKGIDRSSLGIPSEEEYVARYCQGMGIGGIEKWEFYLAFSFFRLAAILQGVAKRALDGNASSRHAARYGAMVEPLVSEAIQLIE
ncbi:MAG: phosphotransferase family protein [Endozoicomonas sp.]